jgi:hypothetical protein
MQTIEEMSAHREHLLAIKTIPQHIDDANAKGIEWVSENGEVRFRCCLCGGLQPLNSYPMTHDGSRKVICRNCDSVSRRGAYSRKRLAPPPPAQQTIFPPDLPPERTIADLDIGLAIQLPTEQYGHIKYGATLVSAAIRKAGEMKKAGWMAADLECVIEAMRILEDNSNA